MDMAQQMRKARSESIRWYLLVALNVARPAGAGTPILLTVIQANHTDATEMEIRRELDYLEDRELVSIKKDTLNRWHAELTRHGVDIVEYTVEVEPGIARPAIG
ncbi:hypothetical protein ACG04Q_12020 [Roseateles sp. DXS20W]|uniref:Uncharacterized protein n=1 Tax=Pelomonas lactea TaxID=3299030 RepID=A0ABW7GK09_9BURK